MASVVGSALALMIALVSYTVAVPNPMALRKEEKAPVLRLIAADGSLLTERGQSFDYIPIDMLPRHVLEAVISVEDRRFFEHWGLDPSGLARAVFANLRAGRYAQGGSTITQQLAKNLFLSSERRLARKVEELFLAVWLEVRLSKHDILELYLNRVYFGGGAFGIEAASRRYFGKSARELTVPESAVLAGLLKAPSKFSPLSNPAMARARARTVMGKMLAAGYLSLDDEEREQKTAIQFRDLDSARDLTGFEYAIDMVLERLPQITPGTTKVITVHTTLHGALQTATQHALTRMLEVEEHESQAGQGAVMVLGLDGGIRAVAGGRSHADSQFNRATKARRQPGSTFKPFVYLSAVESGMKPDDSVQDVPFIIQGWSPRNDNGSYRGPMSMRQALAQSVNTVAVRLHTDHGVKRTIATARRLGIRSDLRDGASLALGTSEVSLMEMTGAYTVFANGGFAVEPYIIKRIEAHSRVLYERQERVPLPVVAPAHVAAMNDMLNAALVAGTGKRATLARHPAAGKTGTSQDFRDAWFVGYTGHLAAGVWIGNDNGRPMHNIMGGNLPAKLWREIMTAAHKSLEPKALPGTSIAATLTPQLMPPPAKPEPVATGPVAVPSAAAAFGRPVEALMMDELMAGVANGAAAPAAAKPKATPAQIAGRPKRGELVPVPGPQLVQEPKPASIGGFASGGFSDAVAARRSMPPGGMMGLGAPTE